MSDGGEYVEFLRRIFERRSEQKERAGASGPFRTLGILGSARNDGKTAALTSAVFQYLDDAAVLDLNDFAIDPYSYESQRGSDDFYALVRFINEAEVIVFASPVYWYAMSGPMKILFDRLTDLTDHYKSVGRALAGKSAFLIATSNSPEAPACFEPPFADTARYFDMRWGGMLHAKFHDLQQLPTDVLEKAQTFAAAIQKSADARARAAA